VQVTSKVIHEANKQKHYTVDAKYPQIAGDPRFDNFNKEARAMITKDVAAFKAGETGAEADTVRRWQMRRENRLWMSAMKFAAPPTK